MDIKGIILDLIAYLITSLGTIAIALFIAWLKKKIDVEKVNKVINEYMADKEKRELIEDIVSRGVLYAQQKFGMQSGEKRFEEAYEYIAKELQDKGFDITDKEIEVLIEGILLKLKNEFKEQWNKE